MTVVDRTRKEEMISVDSIEGVMKREGQLKPHKLEMTNALTPPHAGVWGHCDNSSKGR
jgi:hypothetical protein